MYRHRTIVFILGMVIGAAAQARAQTSGFTYVFAGPVVVNNIGDRAFAWSGGVGAEAWIARNISAGGELGFVHLPQVTTSGAFYASFMPEVTAPLFSGNASRYFNHASGTTRSFITGGLSVMSGEEGMGFFNVGGGIEHRMSRHTALRFEVRDQLGGLGSVLLAFRVGVTFR